MARHYTRQRLRAIGLCINCRAPSRQRRCPTCSARETAYRGRARQPMPFDAQLRALADAIAAQRTAKPLATCAECVEIRELVKARSPLEPDGPEYMLCVECATPDKADSDGKYTKRGPIEGAYQVPDRGVAPRARRVGRGGLS